MSLGAIGAFLIVLMVVFAFGNLWFHLVEWVLGRIKSLFTRRKDPTAWHPLSPEEQDDEL